MMTRVIIVRPSECDFAIEHNPKPQVEIRQAHTVNYRVACATAGCTEHPLMNCEGCSFPYCGTCWLAQAEATQEVGTCTRCVAKGAAK